MLVAVARDLRLPARQQKQRLERELVPNVTLAKLGRRSSLNGRKVLLVCIVLMQVFAGISFRFYGYENTWRLWNIPTLMPPFSDLRVLPGGAESFRAGFNPIHNNPGDPLDRPFNLPFAWYFVFYTGIGQDDTIWIGIVLALGYLFCTWVFLRPIGLLAACLTVIILFSPASMLAVERGNVDLFIFMLCTLALLFLENHVWPAAMTLMAATFLKLFPIFGLAMFVHESPSNFRAISVSAVSAFLAYAVLTYPNTVAAFAGTENGSELSYGVNVIPLYMQRIFGSEQLFILLTLILPLAALGLCLFAFFLGSQSVSMPASESRHLSAFRLGALIYVGTFFLGNNWDYRLIFLLFTIPQLVEWAYESPAKKPARWTIASLAIGCWYLIDLRVLGLLSFGGYIAFILDQVSKWVLFTGLCYLFLASAPDWLKIDIQKSLTPHKPKTL
jgi:hypothetical protein